MQVIRVHYWAAARSAAGVAEEDVDVPGPVTLADLRADLVRRHPESDRLADVIKVCSVVIGDRPVSSSDPGSVLVEPGDTVEFLPPFAGG
ncbi:molybdopterin synthase sulfur carrier subunit [Nocardioides sp. Root190]|uniref:MoaD/ThiS family protein n=1 Tax=Nocardioides sp. Root190 TaxID=1736488 RepID=UPI0006F46086|nr:MoaD/ThiS family protein [Nocardioides sp. Root190]KRB78211.1 molybdopterin synthase sulfur carrier subunit [Nocardioides sp. Root190]